MPCLSSKADSDLNESIRVSNAESQLAVPLMMTTFFGSSAICSPNGSAVWTGAAVAAGAGAAGVGVAGVLAAGGDCACRLPIPIEIAAGISAAMARRTRRGQFIRYSPWPYRAVASRLAGPVHLGDDAVMLTREVCFRPMIDTSWASVASGGADTELPHWPIRHLSPYKMALIGKIP